MQNFEVLDYLIKNNKQNQGGGTDMNNEIKCYYYELPAEIINSFNSVDISVGDILLELLAPFCAAEIKVEPSTIGYSTVGPLAHMFRVINSYSGAKKLLIKVFDVPTQINAVNGDSNIKGTITLIGSLFDRISQVNIDYENVKSLFKEITKEEYDNFNY